MRKKLRRWAFLGVGVALVVKKPSGDFLGGLMVKIPPANAGDRHSVTGPGRFPMLWGN